MWTFFTLLFLAAEVRAEAECTPDKSLLSKQTQSKHMEEMVESGGRNSLGEEGALQDEENQKATEHGGQKEFFSDACIEESFPGVEHTPKKVGLYEDFKLEAPDLNEDWKQVKSEKECGELMRRNKNASAYTFDVKTQSCDLFSKAIWDRWGSKKCVGYRKTDLCAATVEGFKRLSPNNWEDDFFIPFKFTTMGGGKYVQVMFEKDCVEELKKLMMDHSFSHKQSATYLFLPTAKSGEMNCGLGVGYNHTNGNGFGKNTPDLAAENCIGQVIDESTG